MTQHNGTDSQLAALSTDAQARLDRAHVLFAHQSVGQNIIDGVASIEQNTHVGLNLVDLKKTAVPAGPFFAHARLGQNGDPKSKTDAFVSTLESGLGDRLDVAFQKYCFADIDARTDVEAVFNYYRHAMEVIHRRFPGMVLVHVTTPLTEVQSGPKAVIKRLLGRMPDHYEDNIARERYNDLMRRTFAGREPVFDLATLEASVPGEAPKPIQFQGKAIYALLPESSSDGGHLNDPAKARVARELLAFLAHVLPERRTP